MTRRALAHVGTALIIVNEEQRAHVAHWTGNSVNTHEEEGSANMTSIELFKERHQHEHSEHMWHGALKLKLGNIGALDWSKGKTPICT